MDKKKIYSTWFLVPAMAVFTVFFLIPLLLSLYFSVFHTAIQVYIFVYLSLSYVGEALD